MKKPVKVVVWALVGILALVVVIVLALPLWIGPVVTGVAEKVAPQFTGTDFKMEKFALNPYSGKIDVEGVNLSNPKGYDEPTAFSVKGVHVSLDMLSLFSNKIHVREIVVDSPFVSYVFDKAGSNNFERIAAVAQSKTQTAKQEPAAEKKATPEEKKPGKKVVIDRLSISGTKVKYRMITLPIPLPDFTDIGKESEDGATMKEVGDTVMNKAKESITGLGGNLGAAAGKLGEGATNLLKGAGDLVNAQGVVDSAADAAKSAGKLVDGGAKAATDAVKSAGNLVDGGAKAATDAVKSAGNLVDGGAKAATDAAKNAGKAATDGAKNALKAVGGLLGK